MELLTYAALLALGSLAMLPVLLLRRRPSGYRGLTRPPKLPPPSGPPPKPPPREPRHIPGANYVGQPPRKPRPTPPLPTAPRKPPPPKPRRHLESPMAIGRCPAGVSAKGWQSAVNLIILEDIRAVAAGRRCSHAGGILEDSGQVECIACGQVLQRRNPPPPERWTR